MDRTYIRFWVEFNSTLQNQPIYFLCEP